MNNKNKILVGCLALLLVLSVGYALFSDTITINGTATAKGNFDIGITYEPNMASTFKNAWDYVAPDGVVKEENGYKNDSCIVNDDNVTINVDLLYPGARKNFILKFTNNGSISGMLSEQNITNDSNMCFDYDGNELYSDDECYKTTTDSIKKADLELGDFYEGLALLGVQLSSGEIYSIDDAPDDVMAEFIDEQQDLTLKPGNSLYFVVSTYFSTLVSTDSGKFMGKSSFTLEFPFTQVTN